MNTEVLSGILSTTLIILSAISIQFKNAGKARTKSLKELREREVLWAIYAHELRVKYATETGKTPPKLPTKLSLAFDEVSV